MPNLLIRVVCYISCVVITRVCRCFHGLDPIVSLDRVCHLSCRRTFAFQPLQTGPKGCIRESSLVSASAIVLCPVHSSTVTKLNMLRARHAYESSTLEFP